MNKPLLSVIIPVFNASETIEECLKSVLNQTINDVEIIVVDDNSTDNSASLIKKNSVIYIKNNENLGAGASRNIGIEASNGKYIGFIDNDDFIEPDYFEKAIKALEKDDAEIAVSYKITNHTENKKREHIILTKDLKEAVFVDRTAPWAKVIKKDFFIQNNIKFDLTRGEDIYPAFLEAYLSDKITVFKDTSYHCRIRKSSISHREISKADIEEIKIYKKIIDKVNGDGYWMKLIKKRGLISLNFLYKNAPKALKKLVLEEYKTVFKVKFPYLEYLKGKFITGFKNLLSHIRSFI